MDVCEVCCNFMSNTDSDIRKSEHLAGKQHMGWQLIRDKLAELKAMNDGKGPPAKSMLPSSGGLEASRDAARDARERDDRRGERDRDRDRDYDRKDRDRRDDRDRRLVHNSAPPSASVLCLVPLFVILFVCLFSSFLPSFLLHPFPLFSSISP